MAHLLMAETVADPQVFLHNFFSLTFFSLQLDLSNKKKHTLYLAISPGKYFKEWLAVIAQCDMKTKLNRLHNKPSSLFESYTTFVVKTDITDHDDIDLFLEKNIETILKYERMAWLGNAEAPEHNKLQWPANLQELTLFKDWFNIDVYDDSCRL